MWKTIDWLQMGESIGTGGEGSEREVMNQHGGSTGENEGRQTKQEEVVQEQGSLEKVVLTPAEPSQSCSKGSGDLHDVMISLSSECNTAGKSRRRAMRHDDGR